MIPEVFSGCSDRASFDDAFEVFCGTLVMLFVHIVCMAGDVTSSDRFLAKATNYIRILFPHAQKGRDRNFNILIK